MQVALQGGDPRWEECLACAVAYSAAGRANVTGRCGECFAHYCWNGTVNEAAVEGEYMPPLGPDFKGGAGRVGAPAAAFVSLVVLFVVGL